MPPQLPLEVVHKVIQDNDDLPALAACCRVARSFLHESRRCLYRRLVVRLYVNEDQDYYFTPSALSLLNTLARSDDLARLVKEIEITAEEPCGVTRAWIGAAAQCDKVFFDFLMLCDNVRSATVLEGAEDACAAALSRACNTRLMDDRPETTNLEFDTLDLRRPTRAGIDVLERHPEVQHLSFSSKEYSFAAAGIFDASVLGRLSLSSLAFGEVDVDAYRFLNRLPRATMAALTRLELPRLLDDLTVPLPALPSVQHLVVSRIIHYDDITTLLDHMHLFPSLRTLSVSAHFPDFEAPAACTKRLLDYLPKLLPVSLESLALLTVPTDKGQYRFPTFEPSHFLTLLSSSLPPNLRLLTYDRRHIPLTVPHVDWEADNLRAHIRMWNELEDECRERGIWCKGLRAGPAEWDPYCERPLLLP